MNFIIVGDKYQKGMKSKGCAGLLKVDKNNNLFQYQYSIIKKTFPCAKIIYICGFEHKKISNFISKSYDDVICVFNNDYDNFNDAYSISLVENFLCDNTFITLGYTLFDKKVFNKFNMDLGTQIFINKNQNKDIGCVITNNNITNISFDLPNSIDDIYYFSKQDATFLQKLLKDLQYKNYFIFELINKLIDNGSIIKPFFHKSLNKIKTHEYTK